MLYIAVFIAIATVAVMIYFLARQRDAALRMVNEDAAFEGTIDYFNLDPGRIGQLKPLVDRAGVLSRGIREQNNSGERHRVVETFDIFVIDINGAIHDVVSVESRAAAGRIASDLAQKLDIPLDDPDHILRGN